MTRSNSVMMSTATPQLKLGVNVDHVATLRQARGTRYPNPVKAALLCEQAGAHGITVHLREDRRHIQEHDVARLKPQLNIALNLEMAVADEIVDFAEKLAPDEVCLVPERREELTTEGGLDVVGQLEKIQTVTTRLKEVNSLVSLFIDPDPKQIRAAHDVGAPCIELHTGTVCDAQGDKRKDELARLVQGAQIAHDLGLQVNAGHGINLDNLYDILEIPHLDTLNIGHSIVAEAVFAGLTKAVQDMLAGMAAYNGGRLA